MSAIPSIRNSDGRIRVGTKPITTNHTATNCHAVASIIIYHCHDISSACEYDIITLEGIINHLLVMSGLLGGRLCSD